MKLGLGTVQFGLPYGATNADGQVKPAEAARILDRAQALGVEVLDTAAAYGESESVLGKLFAEAEIAASFRIVSKTLPLRVSEINASDIERVRKGFASTLERLGLPRIDAMLVHHADDVLNPGGDLLYQLLEQWKADGLVTKIGVSVYDATQIHAVTERYAVDLIQLPINLLDQRLLHDGCLSSLKKMGVEIHARSIFLQGILLVDAADVPDNLSALRPILRRLDTLVHDAGSNRLAAALAFIDAVPEIDYAVVGAQTVGQLEAICAARSGINRRDWSLQQFAACAVEDDRLINPALWK